MSLGCGTTYPYWEGEGLAVKEPCAYIKLRVPSIANLLKAKFHYDILVADRSEAGRRSAASWNLACHLAIAAS